MSTNTADKQDAAKAAIAKNIPAATPTVFSTIPLAIGGALGGIIEPIGGVINYVATAIANNQIDKVLHPEDEYSALRKLDEKALTMLKAQRDWLEKYRYHISFWRKEKDDPNYMFNATTTMYERKQTTILTWDICMQASPDQFRQSYPNIIADLEEVLARGGKRKLSDEEKSNLRSRILYCSEKYAFTRSYIQEIFKKLESDEELVS